jgi:hypothetical protein
MKFPYFRDTTKIGEREGVCLYQITLVLGEIQRFSNICYQGNTTMVYSELCHP